MKASKALREAVQDAYRTHGDLRLLVQDVLGERYDNIVGEKHTVPEAVLAIVNRCEGDGRLLELVLGAYAGKPGNRKLQQIARPLEAAVSPDGTGVLSAPVWRALLAEPGELESLVLPDVPFEDALRWAVRLMGLCSTICRIEPRPAAEGLEGFATGFLVAPDVVMTNDHVVAPLRGSEPSRVVCRFDFATSPDGKPPSTTRPVGLAVEWDLLGSAIGEVDVALVRLAEPVGQDEIRGMKRGHIALAPGALAVDHPIVILQHPGARPLKLAIGNVFEVQEASITYQCNTLGGSSGSPCFNSQLQPVALHHVGGNHANYAVAFAAIRDFFRARHALLEKHGLAHLAD